MGEKEKPFTLIKKAHLEPITSLWGDDSILYSGSIDGKIKVWDRATNQCIATWDAHENPNHSFGIRLWGDNSRIYSTDGKTIKIWNRLNGSCLNKYETYELGIIWGDSQAIYSGRNSLNVFNPITGQKMADLVGYKHKGHVTSLWGDINSLYSSDFDTIGVWDRTSNKCITTIDSPNRCYRLWGNDNRLYSAGVEPIIFVWDRATNQCITTWKGHKSAIIGMWGDTTRLYTSESHLTIVWDYQGHILESWPTSKLDFLWGDSKAIYSGHHSNTNNGTEFDIIIWDRIIDSKNSKVLANYLEIRNKYRKIKPQQFMGEVKRELMKNQQNYIELGVYLLSNPDWINFGIELAVIYIINNIFPSQILEKLNELVKNSPSEQIKANCLITLCFLPDPPIDSFFAYLKKIILDETEKTFRYFSNKKQFFENLVRCMFTAIFQKNAPDSYIIALLLNYTNIFGKNFLYSMLQGVGKAASDPIEAILKSAINKKDENLEQICLDALHYLQIWEGGWGWKQDAHYVFEPKYYLNDWFN